MHLYKYLWPHTCRLFRYITFASPDLWLQTQGFERVHVVSTRAPADAGLSRIEKCPAPGDTETKREPRWRMRQEDNGRQIAKNSIDLWCQMSNLLGLQPRRFAQWCHRFLQKPSWQSLRPISPLQLAARKRIYTYRTGCHVVQKSEEIYVSGRALGSSNPSKPLDIQPRWEPLPLQPTTRVEYSNCLRAGSAE